jgi:hypothetical protein
MRRSGLLTIAALICSAIAAHAEESTPAPGAKTEAPSVSAPQSVPTPNASDEKAQPARERVAEKPNALASARFSLRRVDGGFLRFDAQTGEIAFCNSQEGGWGCQAVPQNRAALEQEVERLRAEVAELKKQLKTDEPPRPPRPIPPPAASPPKPGNGDMTFAIPGREHITRAVAAVQDAWQRFVDLVIGFKNDVLRGDG